MNDNTMNYQNMLVLCILMLVACEGEIPQCAITESELLAKEGNEVFIVNSTTNTNLPDEFRDKGVDSIVGGYYTFYGNRNLKSYYFLKDANTSIYTEQYDSAGLLMYEEGHPLVHKAAELIDDSLTIKLYFFVLNKKYSKINIVNSDRIIPVKLQEDSLFSNGSVAKFVIRNLHHEQDINAYIDVEYANECTGEIKSFRDSVNLHYKPLTKRSAFHVPDSVQYKTGATKQLSLKG